MLQRTQLHDYQVRGVSHIIEHPRAMIQLFLSAGKTVISLTAASDLLNTGHVYGVLVLAPRRVADMVWAQEAEIWEQTTHLNVCVLRGDKAASTRNLHRMYDVYVINYESIPWLVTTLDTQFLRQRRHLPFDMLICDEVTRLKNATGKRASLLRMLLPHFERRVGLTGTPAPNGYIDLHGQYLAIDDGCRLGYDKQVYQEKYFITNQYSRRITPTKTGRKIIEGKIANITLSLLEEEHIELPDTIYNEIKVVLPAKNRRQYEDLETTFFAELDHGDIEVFNAAALSSKCRQMANGTVIDTGTGEWHPVHQTKLEALDDVFEEAAGSPLLIAYQFRPDMRRILARYGKTKKIAYLGPGVSDSRGIQIQRDFNLGQYDALIAHHDSAGHGLNLQFACHHVVWFGLTWNGEGWDQLNGRVRRQGQQSDRVIITSILAEDTIDYVMRDVLKNKLYDQQSLREAMAEYRRGKRSK